MHFVFLDFPPLFYRPSVWPILGTLSLLIVTSLYESKIKKECIGFNTRPLPLLDFRGLSKSVFVFPFGGFLDNKGRFMVLFTSTRTVFWKSGMNVKTSVCGSFFETSVGGSGRLTFTPRRERRVNDRWGLCSFKHSVSILPIISLYISWFMYVNFSPFGEFNYYVRGKIIDFFYFTF